MNFTREPIIESIITAKDGYKLAVRNTKSEEAPEYFVEAVEVVSFGQSVFFRSQERPQAFLVPVSDFEVVETKEMRVALKSANLEKSIKISGGKEPQIVRKPQEMPQKAPIAVQEGSQQERERDRKRSRRRGKRKFAQETEEKEIVEAVAEEAIAPALEREEVKQPTSSASVFSQLFPPPSGLISESFRKFEPKEAVVSTDAPAAKEPIDEIWSLPDEPLRVPFSQDMRPPREDVIEREKTQEIEKVEEQTKEVNYIVQENEEPNLSDLPSEKE